MDQISSQKISRAGFSLLKTTYLNRHWFKEKVKENIGIGNFTMVLLFVHLLRRNGANQTRGFFPLVSRSKKKCRNFNIHLGVLFKFLCMMNNTKCISRIIRLSLYVFMWFDFNLTMLLYIPVFFQFL